MPNTYTLIEAKTLTTSTASVTFSSIPATFTDLCAKLSVRTTRTGTDADDELFVEFNGSGGTDYRDLMIEGNGTTVRSVPGTSQSKIGRGHAPTDNATASVFGNTEYYIPNYASAANKSVSFDTTMENNATYSLMSLVAGLWSNSAAITSIKFSALGTFDQYSTFYLYGIKNS